MATGLGTSSQYITLMPSEYHPLAQIICIIVVLKVLKLRILLKGMRGFVNSRFSRRDLSAGYKTRVLVKKSSRK